MDVDDDSSPLAIRVEFFFLLAASQNKNPQLFGTTAAAASTRSETKDERYKKKNLSFSSFFVIGLFCRDDQVSFGPAAVPPHCWVIPGQRISLVVVFFAAPFFYFNQVSPFYILRFACRRNARKTLRLLLPSYDIIMPSVVVAVAV